MNAPVGLREDRRWGAATSLAVVVHAVFLSLLVFGFEWQNHATPPPVQAELWTALPDLPTPPAPAPEPTAPVEAPPPVEVAPAKPDIAIEKAPKIVPPVTKTPRPQPPDKLAQREAELQKLDRSLREKSARAQQEQAKSDQAEEQRLTQLLRDADAKQRSQADAARGNVLQGFRDRIQAKIKENTIVPSSVPSGITLVVRFVVLPDGSVLDGSLHVVQSSGSPTYDDAVQRAVIAAQPLPMPDDLAMRRQLRDLSLKTTNVR